jgi:hypothetical protein
VRSYVRSYITAHHHLDGKWSSLYDSSVCDVERRRMYIGMNYSFADVVFSKIACIVTILVYIYNSARSPGVII